MITPRSGGRRTPRPNGRRRGGCGEEAVCQVRTPRKVQSVGNGNPAAPLRAARRLGRRRHPKRLPRICLVQNVPTHRARRRRRWKADHPPSLHIRFVSREPPTIEQLMTAREPKAAMFVEVAGRTRRAASGEIRSDAQRTRAVVAILRAIIPGSLGSPYRNTRSRPSASTSRPTSYRTRYASSP
jgi:hypothetical protein